MASPGASHPNIESPREKASQTKPRRMTRALLFLDERFHTYFVQNEETSRDWV